jgi:hypothetical protein
MYLSMVKLESRRELELEPDNSLQGAPNKNQSSPLSLVHSTVTALTMQRRFLSYSFQDKRHSFRISVLSDIVSLWTMCLYYVRDGGGKLNYLSNSSNRAIRGIDVLRMQKLNGHGCLFRVPRLGGFRRCMLLLISMGSILSQVQLDKVLRPINFILLALTLYGVRVVRRAIKVRGELAAIGFLPGTRYMYGLSTIIGRILPPIPHISRMPSWPFALKHRSKRTRTSSLLLTF